MTLQYSVWTYVPSLQVSVPQWGWPQDWAEQPAAVQFSVSVHLPPPVVMQFGPPNVPTGMSQISDCVPHWAQPSSICPLQSSSTPLPQDSVTGVTSPAHPS